MFRTILVPVDGSPFSEHALPVALGIARKNAAVVHVALVHVPDTYSEMAAAHWEDEERPIKRHEQEYLDALHRRLPADCRGNVQTHHLEGLVAETLEEEIAERGIQLVVMSTHGWGYISRAILGSVADRLMRHLTVPLLLVHTPGGTADLNNSISFRRVLIPLDGSSLAEAILEPARALGNLSQAEFQLLRVVAPPHQFLGSLSRTITDSDKKHLEERQQKAAGYLEKVAQEFRNQSLSVRTHVAVNSSPATAILEEAGAASCDLIALATHGWGGLRRLVFGSVADKVLRSAAVPVLVQHVSQCPSAP